MTVGKTRTSLPEDRQSGVFLYDRGEDGNLGVNPEQAETVKRIYRLFLEGKTPHGICQILMADGILSPGGKEHRHPSCVKSSLTNLCQVLKLPMFAPSDLA